MTANTHFFPNVLDFTMNVHLRALYDLAPIGRRLNITPPEFKVFSRKEWGSEDPKVLINPLEKPVKRVNVFYSDTSECHAVEECKQIIRQLQRSTISQGADDISFNFLVGGDGNIYEGVGIIAQGHHTHGHNHDSIGIALIGQQTEGEAPKNMMQTLQLFLNQLIEQNYLTADYKLS